jgi:hypothetical protein
MVVGIDKAGIKYLPSRSFFILSSKTVSDMVGECLESGIMRVLAEEVHFAEEFFRLESLEAGEVMQKFRTYGIKFAIVVSPQKMQARRFKEMVAEENRGKHFGVFTDRRKAEEWLLRGR